MENKEKKMLTTEDLNRTLGKKELYSIAFGHVIGSGVFSLIGIGIGYTGKSAWIGILLSAVFIPSIATASCRRCPLSPWRWPA